MGHSQECRNFILSNQLRLPTNLGLLRSSLYCYGWKSHFCQLKLFYKSIWKYLSTRNESEIQKMDSKWSQIRWKESQLDDPIRVPESAIFIHDLCYFEFNRKQIYEPRPKRIRRYTVYIYSRQIFSISRWNVCKEWLLTVVAYITKLWKTGPGAFRSPGLHLRDSYRRSSQAESLGRKPLKSEFGFGYSPQGREQ